MPAYNEEANIENTIKSWYLVIEKFGNEESRLVVADAGSADKTHEVLLELQKDCPKIDILSEGDKQHGPKVIALYRYAIASGADYIFQTDSDGQTDPDEFEGFWGKKERYDAVIGKRTVRGDGKSRKFVEDVLCTILRVFFGVKIQDANAPFRLMTSEIVEKYIGRLPDEYNLPNVMMTTFFSYYNENICFEEISFKPRQGGTNSINIPKIVKIGWKALSDFEEFAKEMRQSEKK